MYKANIAIWMKDSARILEWYLPLLSYLGIVCGERQGKCGL